MAESKAINDTAQLLILVNNDFNTTEEPACSRPMNGTTSEDLFSGFRHQ